MGGGLFVSGMCQVMDYSIGSFKFAGFTFGELICFTLHSVFSRSEF